MSRTLVYLCQSYAVLAGAETRDLIHTRSPRSWGSGHLLGKPSDLIESNRPAGARTPVNFLSEAICRCLLYLNGQQTAWPKDGIIRGDSMRGSISHILVCAALATVFPPSVYAQCESEPAAVPTSD